MKKKELLAPAGDIEAGYAALYYGADAVYLGLAKFSARANATNFNEAELDEFTAYAHSLQRKVYVALNTVLQEHELDELLENLDICTRCHVDGLIIQDLGVARVMVKKYPWFEMHASTQMAVHNKEGALFLQQQGFKRVVLARELTLAEIKEIASIPNLETEAFIHGALCYSYSGLCLFSSLEYGRSANRGKCLYPCRACLQKGDKKGHFFSMKDMALQEDILNMPVDSLKIEGRKKKALYVAAVTDYYRQILDGKGAEKQKEENIKQIFSRPWCKFHFKGKDKEIVDRDFVGHRGLFIGIVENIEHGKLRFCTNHRLARYDGLQIDVYGDEKPYGFSVQKLFVKHKSVYTAEKGQMIEVELPKGYPHLKRGDKIYLASSSEVKGLYHYEKPKPYEYRNTYDIDVNIYVDRQKISAFCNGFDAEISGEFTNAKDIEKVNDAIQNAFAKTGSTKLSLHTLHIENKENLFIPVSLLNELRRILYAKIKISEKTVTLPEISERKTAKQAPRFIIKVDNLEYLNNLQLDDFAEVIYLLRHDSKVSDLQNLPKNKIRLALPAVCRQTQKFSKTINCFLESGYHKWQVGNYWALQVLPLQQIDLSFDSSMYMLNTQAIAMAAEFNAARITLSLEDNKVNICNLINKSILPTELIVYQDIPLFTSAVCIREQDCKKCNQQPMWIELQQEKRKFKALSDHCQIMVFDDKPFYIGSEAHDLKPDYFRMDFLYRHYDAEKVKEITDKIMQFADLSDCIKGNFLNNNL